MEAGLSLSIVLGVVLGLFYGLSSFAFQRLALKASPNKFVGFMTGGMLLRMAILLAMVTAVMLVFEVEALAFAGSLAVTLILMLGLDTWSLYRRIQNASQDTVPDEHTTAQEG